MAAARCTDTAPASAGMSDGESHVAGSLRITPTEASIFDLLRSVASRCNNPQVTLRVLGEWVLAKIQGQDRSRIYIGVHGMSARMYTDKLMEYVESNLWSSGVIGIRNPKQIGARAPCVNLSGKSIYFLNIKAVVYTGSAQSRVMERPYDSEDLYHADLTINSLVYNINDSVVQDITGRGFDDIKNHLVMTPSSSPLSSILKDPLIILRSIRFASQMNFTLDEHLMRAGRDIRVRRELGSRISRERINHEVSLMLCCKNPVKAMSYIEEMGLFSAVFTFPSNSNPPIDDNCARSCIAMVEELCKLLDSIENSVFSGNIDQRADHRLICMYAALFLILSETVYVDRNDKKASVACFILSGTQLISGDKLNSGPLKPLTYTVSESVALIHKSCEPFAQLFTLVESNDGLDMIKARLQDKFGETSSSLVIRIFAGLLLKEVKEFWRICLLLSIILYAKPVSYQDISQGKRDIYIRTEKDLKTYGKLLRSLIKNHSRATWMCNPMIRNEWQERLDMWQIVNPSGIENEFIDWMKQFNHQLKKPSVVTLKDHFDKAMVKLNRNENQLLERVAILSSMFAVKMKDDCCRTVTNWMELMNGQHIANRSWDGKFTLDSFGIDKNRVYIIDIPRSQATSDARGNDSRQLAFWLGKILVLDGEKPAYLSHLLKVLKNAPRGPLTESMKLGYETHFSLLPSENRIALTYLIKLKLDGLIGKEKEDFIEILNKCNIEGQWLARLKRIPILKKIIEGGEEKNSAMYIQQDGYAAFKLLRHYFTHAPDHSGETGMAMLKNNCVLDLTAWKYLGDFGAEVVFKLITCEVDIKREAKYSQLR